MPIRPQGGCSFFRSSRGSISSALQENWSEFRQPRFALVKLSATDPMAGGSFRLVAWHPAGKKLNLAFLLERPLGQTEFPAVTPDGDVVAMFLFKFPGFSRHAGSLCGPVEITELCR